jgi:hypothetical protein
MSLTRGSYATNARHTYDENAYPMSIDNGKLVLTRMLHHSDMLHKEFPSLLSGKSILRMVHTGDSRGTRGVDIKYRSGFETLA